jgi:hypothetical protein
VVEYGKSGGLIQVLVLELQVDSIENGCIEVIKKISGEEEDAAIIF